MAGSSASETFPMPTLIPLGDSSFLVRFGTVLTDSANRAAIALASELTRVPVPGVVEIMPNLVSVLLRYDPLAASPAMIQGELRLRLFGLASDRRKAHRWTIPVVFDGPDLDEAATSLGMTAEAFITAHNASPLRVLATGFAPGFVYCGLHPEGLVLPRRTDVRSAVPAGSVLFAAGQTAITATEMPTGWHVIGRTDFSNFQPLKQPPTRLAAGDVIRFEVAP
ncbi:5-oxoprolinase subunit B family protein [Devosia sp.]|uniref:5-oxoprolinase subunit B family protein n=1 Tax=Devosia sp. TaxID=1871048 RepID=UPI002FC73B5D